MALGQSLPDVLRQPQTENLIDLAGVALLFEIPNRGDPEFLVDPLHAFGIEARIVADPGKLRAGPGPQSFELSPRARRHEFPDNRSHRSFATRKRAPIAI